MKYPLVLACLVLISTLTASAQRSGGGGGRSSVPGSRNGVPDPNSSTLSFVSGKVVIDDGSLLTDSVTIQTICRGQKHTETHTDSNGNFFFQLGGRFATSGNPEYEVEADSRNNPASNVNSSSSSNLPSRSPDHRSFQDCDVQASLAGFTSDIVQLGAQFSASESVDIGHLVLHRLGAVQGFTISVTTAQAPDAARKAFETGQKQVEKSKWQDAQKSFETAVGIYPKFAVAWFALGQMELRNRDAARARASFQQAIAADARYINPYYSLAQLALLDQNWPDLTAFSDKLLALNPLSFPEAWLWNSLGNFCLRNLAAAEKSARRGLELDVEHRVPRLEYVMGMVLLRKLAYEQAAEHLRAFLSLTTKPAEVAEAQKQLHEVARLSAAAVPSAGQKR